MWLCFYIVEKMEYLSSVVFHTVILKMLSKRQNQEMRLRFYVEYKVGVCIIDTIPRCHAKMLSKGAESRNVTSFLYSGTMEYVSSIVFHTVKLNKLSKKAKIKKCGFVTI